MSERKIVVPGETIVQGSEFLPGEGTRREGDKVVAGKYGLAEISDKLIKIIPLSGPYEPRRGNAIIGTVMDITFRGWLIDYGNSNNGFLSVSEVPRYIGKGELEEHFTFGDVIFCKVWGANGGNIDLSVKMRGFGKLIGGQLMKVNPHKVPRIIGKEGSMVNLIKNATDTNITVGQNGFVWIKSEKIENELNAKKIIEFICENSYIQGLTVKVEEFVKELGISNKGSVEIVEENTDISKNEKESEE